MKTIFTTMMTGAALLVALSVGSVAQADGPPPPGFEQVNLNFDKAARVSGHGPDLLEQIKQCNAVYRVSFPIRRDDGSIENQLLHDLGWRIALEQLGIEGGTACAEIRVHFGGPVESGRGFVLHSGDYRHDSTLQVDQKMALTATVDILTDIAQGRGPRCSLLALGYAGWGPGQLDSEFQANGWLSVAADETLIFDDDLDSKWERAIGKLGIDVSLLSGEAGHA